MTRFEMDAVNKHFKNVRRQNKMKMVLQIIGMIILGLLLGALSGLLFAIFVSLIWNAVMPAIFGLPCITYWQAYLLYLLCYLLFNRVSASANND